MNITQAQLDQLDAPELLGSNFWGNLASIVSHNSGPGNGAVQLSNPGGPGGGGVPVTTPESPASIPPVTPNSPSGSSLPGGLSSKDLLQFGELLGGKLLEAFGSQHKNSYSGTAADPVNVMSGVKDQLNNLSSALYQRLGRGVNLSGAEAASKGVNMPTYTGGGLTMPVGIMNQHPFDENAPNIFHSPGYGPDAAGSNDKDKALSAFKMLGVNI